MKRIIAMMIGLAILTAIPLAAMAQTVDYDTAEPEDPGSWDPYWYYWPEQGGFDYADGVANGTYVDFLLNETDGTISEYTVKHMDYGFYYPMAYYDDGREGYPGQDGWNMPEPTDCAVKFFDSVTFDGFAPNGKPGAFGQSLVFLGQNLMMTIGDYEYSSMYFQFGEENGTMAFTIPDGIEISEEPHYYALYDIEEPVNMTGIEYDYAVTLPNYDGDVGFYPGFNWDEAWLRSGNITCSIWVDRGTVEIVGRKIIVTTFPGASVSTSSWIEYAWQYQHMEPWFAEGAPEDDRDIIASAIENGQIAAVGYLYAEDGGAQYTDSRAMNDPSFKLIFMNVEQNRFEVQVESEIKTGRIVTLNVNKVTLEAESVRDLYVLLDDEKVRSCASMEELVELRGGSEAGFYMIPGSSHNTIFVYVPHFSTRIITVGLEDTLGSSIALPGIVAGTFIAVAVGLVVMRGKRGRDEF